MNGKLFLFIKAGLFLFMNGGPVLFMSEGRGAISSPTTTPTNPETNMSTITTATIFLFIEPSNPASRMAAVLVKGYG
jgi:hypothetical protein